MAATATEQPVLDRLTVLASGGEHKAAFAPKSRGESSVMLGDELRKFRPAGGKETIRAALAIKEGETRFNVRNAQDFKDRFGSGLKDEKQMTPAERASYRRAQELVQRNSTIALFLEARALPPGQRDAYVADRLMKTATGARGTVDFKSIRQTALESIIDHPSFVSLFPELNQSGMNKAMKIDFIEKTLMPAEDERFASRLGTRMQEVYRDSVKLTAVEGSEERSKLEASQREETLRMEQHVKAVKSYMEGRSIKNPTTGAAYTEQEIAHIIRDNALTAEGAMDAIAFDLMRKASGTAISNAEFTDIKKMQVDIPNTLADLQGRLESARMAITEKKRPADLAAYIKAYPNNPDALSYQRLDGDLTQLKAQYGTGNRNVDLFRTRAMPLYEDKTVVATATAAKEVDLRMKEADLRLRAMATVDVDKARDLRTLEEEELIAKLDGILGESIADVLEERYDVMEERMGRLSTEQQKQAEQNIQKLVLELKKKMNQNWIGYDVATHKKTTNKDQIKKDVTHLGFTYDKDMALKQLIARDLFKVTRYDTLNMVDGKNSTRGGGTLNAEQLAQVNKVFELAGGEYRDKLFADLLAARTFGDRKLNFGFGIERGGGTLAFTRGEWQQLMKMYEPEITKGIEGNREAAAALRSMEAQGVKIDANMKWIWYILAVILGGSVLGPLGVAGATKAVAGLKAASAAGTLGAAAADYAAHIGGAAGAAAITGKVLEHS